MLTKPQACVGCPLYGNGHGYVRDRIRPNADVSIVLGYCHLEESRRGGSGHGGTWGEVSDKYLPIIGRKSSEVNIIHVIRCLPQRVVGSKTHSIPMTSEFLRTSAAKQAAKHCAVHDQDTPNVRLVIALGELPFRKYGGSVSGDAPFNFRGHLLPTEGE